MANVFILLRDEKKSSEIINKRQIPLSSFHGLVSNSSTNCEKNLMMVIDLCAKGLSFDRPQIEDDVFMEFDKKFKVLDAVELKASLSVSKTEFQNVLSQMVPCVGCRRSVERLHSTIAINNYVTLEPIKIRNGVLSVCDKHHESKLICQLFFNHETQLNILIGNQPRNKKNSRCNLHSLESFRTRPFSETWHETWESMKQNCKEKMTIIDASELHATLDEFLKRHKFCQECRTKVEKAYTLLMSDANPAKEKGYVSAIYNGIKRCLKDKHIHLPTKFDYINDLIKRAEPEILGSHSRHRERHAKTMEIAQEEVLTCLGICFYNRLRRIQQCVKEEENACQVLAAVAVHALCRSFDIAVEKKRGVDLELIFDEISREDREREEQLKKRKMKKSKKRSKRNQKNDDYDSYNCQPESMLECDYSSDNDGNLLSDDDSDKLILCDGTIIDVMGLVNPGKSLKAGQANKVPHQASNSDKSAERSHSSSIENLNPTSCSSCHDNDCAQRSSDAGYSSETQQDGPLLNNISSRGSSIASSREGSEACSDACCKEIEGARADSFLSLEQMLNAIPSEDDDDDTDSIPAYIIMEFKSRDDTKQKRERLREKLRLEFKQLCAKNC